MKKEPEIDTNPYRSLEAAITPTEFEKFCLETVKAYAQKEGLKDFVILHNQKIEAYDSTYQIDVYAEYTALGDPFPKKRTQSKIKKPNKMQR